MRRLARLATVLCGFAWLAAAGPATVHAQAASYQAINWDKEMILPPGAYRASKPIDINGSFIVRTQPGTLIEGVSFRGRDGVQQWIIKGTLMRRVRIGGQMDVNAQCTDSVFEDCEFNKDSNWFRQWWSTRWHFENCIFTKQYIRGDLPPLDYSAHAKRCTFYGVKLPPVGFKENPANYLQSENMVCEKCRFVDCDVPQTFLAATVDCVFEGCRFEPKNKVNWPKETGPIKVTAYYAGTGSEPSSFLNGPLSVQFSAAPRDAEYGSALPHTQSGGHVTLTNLHFSSQWTPFGTVPKKASEIVETPAAAPDAATPTPAPSAPLVVSAGEVHGLEEMLRAMPSNLEVITGGEPNAAGVEAANLWLVKTYAGRAVSMRMTLESTQATGEDGYAYRAAGRQQGVLYHGTVIPSRAMAMFRAASAGALGRVQPNADFLVRGIVRKAEFVGRGHALTFTLNVGEAQVFDNPLIPMAAPAAVPAPADPTAGSGAVQVIGAWTVLVRKDGGHWEQTFGADHSATMKGQRFGSWEIKGGQFLVRFDTRGLVDTYELPVREGVMYGKNLEGLLLTLTRHGQATPPAIRALVIGMWDFFVTDGDGSHARFSLNPDGTFSSGDKPIGHWLTFGNSLVFDYDAHRDWHDIFELPGDAGVLTGVNGFHSPLKLTRLGAAAPPTASGNKPQTSYFGSEVPSLNRPVPTPARIP